MEEEKEQKIKEKLIYYSREIKRDVGNLVKWLFLAVVVGCVTGAASTYKNRFYLLNNEMDIIVSSEENMQGISFPLKTRDFKRVKIVRDPSTEKNSYFTYQYINNGWLLVSTINVGQLWKNIGIALVRT